MGRVVNPVGCWIHPQDLLELVLDRLWVRSMPWMDEEGECVREVPVQM